MIHLNHSSTFPLLPLKPHSGLKFGAQQPRLDLGIREDLRHNFQT